MTHSSLMDNHWCPAIMLFLLSSPCQLIFLHQCNTRIKNTRTYLVLKSSIISELTCCARTNKIIWNISKSWQLEWLSHNSRKVRRIWLKWNLSTIHSAHAFPVALERPSLEHFLRKISIVQMKLQLLMLTSTIQDAKKTSTAYLSILFRRSGLALLKTIAPIITILSKSYASIRLRVHVLVITFLMRWLL